MQFNNILCCTYICTESQCDNKMKAILCVLQLYPTNQTFVYWGTHVYKFIITLYCFNDDRTDLFEWIFTQYRRKVLD